MIIPLHSVQCKQAEGLDTHELKAVISSCCQAENKEDLKLSLNKITLFFVIKKKKNSSKKVNKEPD